MELPKPVSADLLMRRDQLPHWQMGGSTYFLTFRSVRGALPDIARKQVLQNILYEHGKRTDVLFGVVMPDHVHLLLRPCEKAPGVWHDLSKILQSMKGASARKINLLLGTAGAVWQAESFDRIIRSEEEFLQKLKYMWINPVKAELVKHPREYRFYANPMNVLEND